MQHPIEALLDDMIEQLHAAAETMRTAADPGASARHILQLEQSEALISELRQVVLKHGVSRARRCLSLVPFALAKGDSARELDLAVDRFSRGTLSRLSIEMDPRNTRFPIDVIFLGGRRRKGSFGGEALDDDDDDDDGDAAVS